MQEVECRIIPDCYWVISLSVAQCIHGLLSGGEGYSCMMSNLSGVLCIVWAGLAGEQLLQQLLLVMPVCGVVRWQTEAKRSTRGSDWGAAGSSTGRLSTTGRPVRHGHTPPPHHSTIQVRHHSCLMFPCLQWWEVSRHYCLCLGLTVLFIDCVDITAALLQRLLLSQISTRCGKKVIP